MKKLFEIIQTVAKVPSFSAGYEDRLHQTVTDYLSFIPETEKEIIILKDFSMIIKLAGKNMNKPIALCSHLDKINHNEMSRLLEWYDMKDDSLLDEIDIIDDVPLSYRETNEKIIGQLDNSVGVGMCLYIAKAVRESESYPPLYLLLSSQEECGMLGAINISEYLFNDSIKPELFLTIDTCPKFNDKKGIVLYRNGFDPDDKISKWFIKQKKDILISEGMTDYIVYGRWFNGLGIPSIAIEPAIYKMHSIGEECWKTDIIDSFNMIMFYVLEDKNE